ncbi:hypothetical protein P4679_22225 [Priestia megaterium]|uniref:hypothetical protein n=1 Tax=Priestia megaterium TaxID=1404 RepID=UPI002E1C923C|nr:hypothetical protein [Priestia megaterium]
MESQTKKIVQPRYRFFDDLYISIESIDKELLSDWSHKEKPSLKYCIIEEQFADEDRVSIELSGAEVFNILEAAEKELKDWNE